MGTTLHNIYKSLQYILETSKPPVGSGGVGFLVYIGDSLSLWQFAYIGNDIGPFCVVHTVHLMFARGEEEEEKSLYIMMVPLFRHIGSLPSGRLLLYSHTKLFFSSFFFACLPTLGALSTFSIFQT